MEPAAFSAVSSERRDGSRRAIFLMEGTRVVGSKTHDPGALAAGCRANVGTEAMVSAGKSSTAIRRIDAQPRVGGPSTSDSPRLAARKECRPDPARFYVLARPMLGVVLPERATEG